MVQVGEEGDFLSDLFVGIEEVFWFLRDLKKLGNGRALEEAGDIFQEDLDSYILFLAQLEDTVVMLFKTGSKENPLTMWWSQCGGLFLISRTGCMQPPNRKSVPAGEPIDY